MNETYPIQDKPQDLSMKTVRKTKSKIKPPNLDLTATLSTSDEIGASADLQSPKSPADLPRECLPIRKRPFVEPRCDFHSAKSPKSAGLNGFAPSQSLAFDYRRVNTAPSSPLRLPPPTINSTLSLTPSSTSSLASVNSAFTHFPIPPLIPATNKSPYLIAAAAASAAAASSGSGYPPTPTDLPSPYTWPSPHPALFSSHFTNSILPHSSLPFPTTALLSPAPSYPSSANSSREDLPVGTISGGTTIMENSESKRRFFSSRSTAADSSSPVPSSPLRSPRTWSHSWPTPVWQCFVQGTMIRFIIPGTETPWQKAEDLGWKDMVAMKVDSVNHFQYAPNGLTIVKIDVISQESSSRPNGHLASSSSSSNLDTSASKSSAFTTISNNSSEVLMYLRLRMAPHRGESSTEILAECSLDHPFYVKEKGWCSIQPHLTIEKYSIPCQEISVGDVCLPPNHPEAVRTPDLCDRFRKFEFEDQLSPLLIPTKGTGVKSVAVSSARSSPSSVSTGVPKGQLTMSPPNSPARKKEKDVDKPKRPMNGFMLFAKKYRLELIQQHPGKDNRAISVLLGEAWKSLPLEDREKYSLTAKVMADEQKKLFPDCWKRKKTLNCPAPTSGQSNQTHQGQPPPSSSSSSRPAIPSSNFGAFTPLNPPQHLGTVQSQHPLQKTAGATM